MNVQIGLTVPSHGPHARHNVFVVFRMSESFGENKNLLYIYIYVWSTKKNKILILTAHKRARAFENFN